MNKEINSKLNSIIGYDSIKLELSRFLDIINNPIKYNNLGVKLPKGILLYGDPGMGKTLIATTFMNATNRNQYICRKNMSNGDFINEITNIFNEAIKNQPSIILLDDMDKFANEDTFHKNAEEYVAIQSGFDLIKNYDVMVIATINDKSMLPNSLIRDGRFDEEYEISINNINDSQKIIKYFLSKKNYVDNLDIDEICKILYGLNCAEIENLINRAGIYAGFENKEKIDMDDIIKSLLRKTFKGPLSLNEKTNEDLIKIAYHEVGHAVVGELLDPDSVSLITLLSHECETGGFTKFFVDEHYLKSKNKIENRIMSLLGGKAITELKFGVLDTGCDFDIKLAGDLTKMLVSDYCQYGFSEHLRIYDRYESEKSKSESSVRVAYELDHYYIKTKEILAKNFDIIEALVSKLLEKQILSHKEIKEIILKTKENRK